uniref:Photosystem I reaction center subunit PsaK n=1 Tax=Helminthora furcellata TaxID=1884666 RepID=A0A1G4NR06_9FLOR|nr:Photosystem I reaction center subunit X [Helminthora furcellata]SCW21100.1 Photosystem I reaction center subunit X [Helminthora furcellata]SCW23960.1 Photosystem I reaction center subunit X [Helminthora furcellata]
MNINNIVALANNNTGWSTQIAFIMIISNVFAIGVGRYAIQVRNLGPSMPIAGLEGFGLTELLATTSLGHVIGAGVILGLRGTGLLA